MKERELAAARAFVDQLQEQVKQQALENRRSRSRSSSSGSSSSGTNGSNENDEASMVVPRAREEIKRLQLTHDAELRDMKTSLRKLQEQFALEKQRGDKLLAENAKLIGAKDSLRTNSVFLRATQLHAPPRLIQPSRTHARTPWLSSFLSAMYGHRSQ